MVRPSLGITGIVLGGSLVASVVVGTTSSSARPQEYGYCPPAKHLVGPETNWHRHALAPGVSLSETRVVRGPQRLEVNVVRAQLDRRTVRVHPLHHAMTTRRPLSRMARRKHLVAAANGVYFSFAYGAPTVPFIDASGPVVLSRHRTMVAGIGANGRAEDGHAWFTGRVRSARGGHRLLAINDVTPPPGLSLYTSGWGRKATPLPSGARTRPIHHGRVGRLGSHHRVTPHGDLLLATTGGAVSWLRSLHHRSAVSLTYHARTDAPRPFRQAYGVGTRVVAQPHHVRSGLYCRRSEIYAARTDIAWRDNGRQLILATVESPRGSENHGVDENQMSQVMVQLGAERSYALDGGGSTELLARLHHQLSNRTRRAGEQERRIPLGIGVYSLPNSQVSKSGKHGHSHKHHHKHHKPKKGLLGVLPPLP
jgi:Phosphodiester glycosidase